MGPLVKQEVSYKRLKSQGKHFIFDRREKNHLFSLIKASLFSVLAAAAGVTLRYDIDDTDPPVHTELVKQRVNNRVVNVKILRLQIMDFLKQILLDGFMSFL